MSEITIRIRFDRDLSDDARERAAQVFAEQLQPVLAHGKPVLTPAHVAGPWGYGAAMVVAVEAA